jgi:hypothetical protein
MHIRSVLSRMLWLSTTLIAGSVLANPAAPPASPAPAAAAPSTLVAIETAVPLAQDGCLDHTVRELGMSAKRAEGSARHWDIAPKFLHGALAKDAGTFTIDFEKTDKATQVRVRASWPGAPKESAVQLEIEERLRLMTVKMTQLCSVLKPQIACTRTPAGGAAAACPAPAGG